MRQETSASSPGTGRDEANLQTIPELVLPSAWQEKKNLPGLFRCHAIVRRIGCTIIRVSPIKLTRLDMKQTFSVAIDRLGGFFDTVHLTRPKVLATLMSRFRQPSLLACRRRVGLTLMEDRKEVGVA
jgi:hypothetical protein